MKRGGEEIYVGPLGTNSCHLIKYSESVNRVPKIRDGYNPATWMLEVSTPAQDASTVQPIIAVLCFCTGPLYEILSSTTCSKHGVTGCNLGCIMTGREWTWASGAEYTSLTAKSNIQKLASHLITMVRENLLIDHKKTLQ